MELRQLEIFLAVADELHFGRAAERLFMTQQSVSDQVRKLEREVGGALFERTSRRVGLSGVGAVLRPEAERVVAQAQHALEISRRAALGHDSVLAVGYAPDAGRDLLRSVVPTIRARDPDLTVLPRPMSTTAQLEALRGGRLHLGIVWTPELAGDLDSLIIAEDPIVMALPAAHPAARIEGPLHSAREIRELVLWPREANPRLYDTAIAALTAAGAVPKVVHTAITLDRQLDLVLAGAAAAVTVASVSTKRIDQDIVYRVLGEPAATLECRLVWSVRQASPATWQFIEFAQQFLSGDAPSVGS
jgi:DNA-binding transcriptional LysR family regulator